MRKVRGVQAKNECVMMIFPGSEASCFSGFLAGKFQGKVGWMLGPSHWKTPRWYIPYAMDNDAFSCFTNKKQWDKTAWMGMLEKAKASFIKPIWCIVPDVVGNAPATIESWHENKHYIERNGWPKAFAVQDGMLPVNVPKDADVVFVGGTTEWKWRTVEMWAKSFPRVHVGRVNELRRVYQCDRLGVESVDGTGWLKKTQDGRMAINLLDWLEHGTPEDFQMKLL